MVDKGLRNHKRLRDLITCSTSIFQSIKLLTKPPWNHDLKGNVKCGRLCVKISIQRWNNLSALFSSKSDRNGILQN